MVEDTPSADKIDSPSFEDVIKRYFLGDICADDLLVRRSGMEFEHDVDQISLEYRSSFGIPASYYKKRKIKEQREFNPLMTNNSHFLTFSKNLKGLFVDERAGILYGGSVRPLIFDSVILSLDDSIGEEVMKMLNNLQLRSRGNDLFKIGEYLLDKESSKDLAMGIKEMYDIQFN